MYDKIILKVEIRLNSAASNVTYLDETNLSKSITNVSKYEYQ